MDNISASNKILPYINTKIKFNWKIVPITNSDYGNVSRSSEMKVTSLLNIFNLKLSYNYGIYMQNFEVNHRVCNEDLQNGAVSLWNQTIFKDIDYKKYINGHSKLLTPAPDTMIIYNKVIDYLQSNYSDIFLYSEVSRSGKGFHFIFNINAPKNDNGYMFANVLAHHAIIDAFTKCGYEKIIWYPEVYDDCTDSKAQGIYLTIKNPIYNSKCTGDYRHIYENNKNDILRRIKNIKKLNVNKSIRNENYERNKYLINLKYKDIYSNMTFNEIICSIKDWSARYVNHRIRWQVFNSLYCLLCITENFTEDNLKLVWTEFAKRIPEENGHNTNYYVNVPYINDWNENKGESKKSLKILTSLGIIKKYNKINL